MIDGDRQKKDKVGAANKSTSLLPTPLKAVAFEDTSSWRVFGPGLLACLADVDAASLMVGAQSGADWGYSLLLLQILLLPVLYFAQELTIRLGIFTGIGQAGCIKRCYGSGWAWTTTGLLVLECVLATICEMSGLAAVAELWDLSRSAGTLVSVVAIVGIVVFCNYRQIEVIGIVLGCFELIFVLTMFWFHPAPSDIVDGFFTFHFESPNYRTLYAANIGSAIMPFMIYFQQSAVVTRKLKERDLRDERSQTFGGVIITQLVMVGAVITYAASRAKSVASIHDMHLALEPAFGQAAAKILISLALVGGSLCAAFVVTLAASWAICETAGWDEDMVSVDLWPSEAPRFYGIFVLVVGIGVLVLESGVHLVSLNIFIEVVNGLLMPITVFFLFSMCCSDLLPVDARVMGRYKALLGFAFSVCALTSLLSVVSGISLGHSRFHHAVPPLHE